MPLRLVVLTLSVVTAVSPRAFAAGPPRQPNAAEIALGLRKLGVVGSVLYVAAHPDDENTALLATLANGALVRAGYLSVTRGDGGQNLIGSEQGPELGLIRTQELLAARRIDGAEQFFTRARDFGYSKSPEETLRIWGKDAVLADMVTVIRRFRPDVLVTRFSPGPADTHGHHTASAILAMEAFRAAADPHFHPEELTGGVTAWQAARLYWNRSSWNIKPGEDLSGHIKMDVGGYNAFLGASYGELAADSRSMHKSQGFGVARSRAPAIEYFKLLAEAGRPTKKGAAKRDASDVGLFDGVDLSWGRFAGAARVRALIDRLVAKFDPAAPSASIAALLAVDAALDVVADAGWRAVKKREVRDLVLACAGIFAEATVPDFRAAPGTELAITASVVDRSPVPVRLEEVRFPFAAGAERVGQALAVPNAGGAALALETKRTVRLPADLALSTPYWLETPPEPGLYRVADPALIGAPEGPSKLEIDFTFAVAGRRFTVARPVVYKWTDPVMGERLRPLEVTPLVSVAPDAGVLLFPGGATKTLGVRLSAGAPSLTGTLRFEAPSGWSVTPSSVPFSLAAKGSEATFVFQVGSAAKKALPGPGTLRVVADVDGWHLSREVVRIEHAHIPIQTLLVDADVRLVPIDLKIEGKKVGYFPGPGDEVPSALRGVGYEVTLLGDEAFGAGAAALGRFDAIVIGVRAFNTDERLRAAHATLMAYVEAGGVLVAQYNTNNRFAPLETPIGPWPFEISQKRVTDETAAVTFTSPRHPALTTPNAIGPSDFEGWAQERGLYFPDKWDPKYEAPLSMHDPGEAPLSGGLLWAHAGRGIFVYTGLAFFRQLPAGVPGAFRLFANLLAGGRAPKNGR
jgi:LmbE family N-acetylglucosaminyl deacetylase